MKNSKSSYTTIIKEICKEEKIELEIFSDSWIFRLKKGNKYKHILGYRYELNPSASDRICCDKSATSDILKASQIPCVEHYFFLSPSNLKYLNSQGNWNTMVRILENHNNGIVCKPNEGGGGNDVYFVDNKIALENIIHRLFISNRSVALSPFYDIINEYRTIILDGEVKAIYKKNIPHVIGDGEKNVLQLLAASNEEYNLSELGEYIKFYYVPLKGEIFKLNWRHNLGQGAVAENIIDEKIIEIVTEMAKKAAFALNIRFASVDVIELEEGFKVLEINSGVTMEKYSNTSNENYIMAKEIYREAILKMFE